MSIDVHWETLAGGPDGTASAEAIRSFIHDKFQQVALPRFIRSVKVHSFDFGSVAPQVEIKDICDPLPDFYDEDEDASSQASDDAAVAAAESANATSPGESSTWTHPKQVSVVDPRPAALRAGDLISRAPTPGIPGGTSNMSYFHLPLGAGLSGTTTPFAAVAGAQFQTGWPDHSHHFGSPGNHSASVSSATPPSSADLDSRPQSQHQHDGTRRSSMGNLDEYSVRHGNGSNSSTSTSPRMRESSPEDLQVVSHVKYSGDIKMVLTAEILLDYPMPSFVGIPLKLTITGLSFDGVALLAYIKKRAHFCFLSPEDADSLIGGDMDNQEMAETEASGLPTHRRTPPGGLLEEIRVESEIGQQEHGKQVLKNVGKVEKFILEQVRRIFEDEFVYPSFWTFLV
ncbi:hypothetical protein K490DRAFT_34060 [Saccharata proteae CBS 121410]|uniref:Mitochondrial distribution and morphology protein 12 n=1 Tax=Saccharata proteae CBS 121410 TaxID=1314787 RepID=A0A9P4I1M2_9PEZI|nr:hypothetical protein K490DRAFT_34060 [Saccharata proteae CBS 121410]